MNFSEALNELKSGNAVFRGGWNGKGIYIKIQFPDKNSKMTSPYIYIDTDLSLIHISEPTRPY